MEKRTPPAYRRLGIVCRFSQELTSYFLFGHRLALHEFFHLLQILSGIERDADTFTSIASAPACFLIIPFKRLWHVVMDHETHIGLVNTHSESNGSDNNIDAFKQESVLISRTCRRIHSRMICQRLYIVHLQQFGQFLDLFTAQTIYNS